MLVTSFLCSSFLQAISAVMLWSAHVQKVPQALKHFCPVKLQTSCDVCGACWSVLPFFPLDAIMLRAVDPQWSLRLEAVHGCVPVGEAIPSVATGSCGL